MKFLIVKLSSLGDVIHTLPMVYRLRKKYPNSQIDWLVGKKGYELLNLIQEINKVYLFNLNSLFLIQKQNYDYVIDVQGLFKTGLISKLSLGKKIIGFKNTREFADIFYDLKINVGDLFETKTHIVDLNLKLVDSLVNNVNKDIKFLIPDLQKMKNDQFKIKDKQKSIVVFPATTWESKRWPMMYWFELIEKLSYEFQIFLCASKSDLSYIQELINKLDLAKIKYENLVGKTSIKDLISLIQRSSIVIGCDSGGLHLSAAINNDHGLPHVIGIYGPTSLFRSGPYNLGKDCLYLSELECIACRKRTCPLGHHNCMNNIIPSYVLDIVGTRLTACCDEFMLHS